MQAPMTQLYRAQRRGHGAAPSCRRFLVGSDSSDDEDDKRVVRSAKDRRGEELRTICDEMRVGAAGTALAGSGVEARHSSF